MKITTGGGLGPLPKETSSAISEIDKNFKAESNVPEDTVYYNVKDNRFCLYGLMLDEEFRRMPKEMAKQVNEGVYTLHNRTSGGRIRFLTDSPYIVIFAKMPNKVQFPHMPQTGASGFDMYIDKTYYFSFIPPVDMESSFSRVAYFNDAIKRNVTINFPLYNNVTDLYIGLKSGSCYEKAEDYKNREKIVFYGSSITQGGCVSRPGLAYPAIISNELDCDYINLGFSGSALGEEIMAEYIAGLEPDIFVLDYDHNAPTKEHLQNTHEKFFKIFRSKCPDTPVVMLSAPNIKFDLRFWSPRREVIKTTYHNAVANGDKNVYFIDGEKLWNENHWDMCTVDRTHPNDLGHFEMAQGILPTISMILHRGN